MAWVKVPAEHHPLFRAALPNDPRVSTMPLFGGVAAKVNGHIFAGLFGRSVVLELPEPLRSEALALDGACPFDPMGNGKALGTKIMLPEDMMDDAPELRAWIARAFTAAAALPRKPPKGSKPVRTPAKAPRTTKPAPKRNKAAPKPKKRR